MPNHKSAKKAMRQNETRRLRNRHLNSSMKTLRKKTEGLLQADATDSAQAMSALTLYKSKVDKAWTKGIYSRSKSSRLKSKADILYYQRFVKDVSRA